MSDIKKKFMDILFEPVEDEEEVQKEVKKEVKPEIKPAPLKAADIMYRKPGQSAFIDLKQETKQASGLAEDKSKDDEYVITPNLSPIFGILGGEDGLVKHNKEIISKKPTNVCDESHLGIVPSPIYGFGQNDAPEVENDSFNNFEEFIEEPRDIDLEEPDYIENEISDQEISLFEDFGENR